MGDRERYERGTRVLDQIYPDWRERGTDASAMPGALGEFARTCVEHCYTDAWSRAEGSAFDHKTRSLITMSALATLGSEEELKMHVDIALNLGHSFDDLGELFLHLAPYIGVPRAVSALRAAGAALSERAKRKAKA